MSSNTYLLEVQTRHQIYLQRLAGGNLNRILPFLEVYRDQLKARLLAGGTEFQVNRLGDLYFFVDRLSRDLEAEISGQLMLDLEEQAQYEAEFQAKALSTAIDFEANLPAPEQIAAAFRDNPFQMIVGDQIQRFTVPEMISHFSRSQSRNIQNLIRAGAIEGRTSQEIVRDVARLTDKRTRQQAGALVRTATNHIATTARTETMRANSDVLEGEEYVATLDARVTITCASLDGTVWPIGEGPIPPLHWACRSTRAPKVKDEFNLFTVKGERASIDGPVSAQTTYNSFLKRQSAEFQDSVLGPERAKLFRQGMSVSKFTDDQGRVLSLDQLKALENLTLQ